jgi:hypothetical protein
LTDYAKGDTIKPRIKTLLAMYINQRLQRKVATGLMILFLAFALVPIYLIMAKFATGGHYAQLCTATGMQTVWVVDEPEATSIQSNATAQSSGQASDGRLMNPFGCCEFCWTSVLAATVLPLLVVFFAGDAHARFAVPTYQEPSVHSYLRRWHVSPRAPPYLFSI